MAITNLISGEIRNKVGGMVGAKWKGKNYVRAYVVPKNPNTPDQQKIRGAFKTLSTIGSTINNGILKPHTAKKFKNMSPYNRFIKLNKDLISVGVPDWTKLKLFDGGAMPVSIDTATGVEATGVVTVTLDAIEQSQVSVKDVYAYGYVVNITQGRVVFAEVEISGATASLVFPSIPYDESDEVFACVATEVTDLETLERANSPSTALAVTFA